MIKEVPRRQRKIVKCPCGNIMELYPSSTRKYCCKEHAYLYRSKPSEQTKAKIAATLTGVRHPPERCEASSRGHMGHIHTKEHKEATSKSITLTWKDTTIREKRLNGQYKVLAETDKSSFFSGGKGQPPNQIMLDYATFLCPIGYLMDKVIIKKGDWESAGWYLLDFALPDEKIDIEIDGSSHRSHVARDAERDKFLRSLGWKVIRIRV